MSIYEFNLRTPREGLIGITPQVGQAVSQSGVKEGLCVVFCPHTTAAITVNENADPDVARDLIVGLSAAFPDRDDFTHSEGNSAAHLKASCVGCSQTLVVKNGSPVLGTWQGIYFCEFDGPRSRRFFELVLSMIGGARGFRRAPHII